MKKSKQTGPEGTLKALASAVWRNALRLPRRAPRRLRLCESLPLGEHRFVAVIEFDGESFLLGGTSASLVLLARLGDAEGKAKAAGAADLPEESVREIGGDRRPRIEAC